MESGRQTAVVCAILVLGFAGIIAQTALLRELLIQFSGNEFSVGIIIGNWVAAEAFGAFVAGRYLKQRQMDAGFFILLTLLFSTLFPLMIMLVRAGKLLAGIPTDIGMTLVQTFLAALFLLFPAAALHGFQFVAATSLHARLSGDENSSSGRVYALESLGTMAGGLLASLALVPFLSSMQIAALNLVLSGAVSIILFGFGRRLHVFAGTAILLVAAPFIFSLSTPLEKLSLSWEWHGKELLTSSNSPYQNIAVIRNGDQITLYTDGLPAATLPHPDIALVEELAHIPMLAHPSPQRVLLIGGGAAGLLAELLKYRALVSVDYVEQDPGVLAAVAAFAPESFTRLLKDPRVRLHYSDARELVRSSGKKYDLVLLGASLPQNLQGNRFFTLEFFRMIRERLAPGGIVSFAVPGSTAYYGAELQEINRTLISTARAAFPYLLVMPGDTNLFLASSSRVDLLEPGTMTSRLLERSPGASLITPEHLSWRMDPGQRDWFARNSGEGSGEINRDFAPRLLSGNLAYATILFNPWLKSFLGEMRSAGAISTAAFMVLVLAGFALIGLVKPALAPVCVIAATGFAGMLLEMMLIFSFQLYTGVMFQSIAMLMALFMGGLCAGSLLAARSAIGDMRLLAAGEAGLLLLAATACLFFCGAGQIPALSPVQAYAAILPLLFAVGLFAGLQYPAAVRMVAGAGPVVCGVGLVYSVDLIGGWFGGVVGGALLLPFLGFSRTALILLSLKTGSFLLLQMQRKKCKL